MTPIEKNIGGNSNLINPIVITASTGHNNNNNTTTTTTTTKKRAMKLVNSKRISLWLLPPKPLVTTLTNIQLDLISKHPHQQQQQQQQLLPTFTPHVTLIGGVSISELFTDAELSRLDLNNNDPVDEIHNRNGDDNDDDNADDNADGDDELHEAAAKIVLDRMKRAFRSFGGIECNFVKERGVFAARIPSASNVNRNNNNVNANNNKNKNNANGNGQADGGEGDRCEEGTIVKWNQSCVSIMERSASFLRAMQVAEEALFHSTADTNNNISTTTIATTTAGTTATTTSSISSTTIIPLENNNRKPSSRNIERHFKPPLYEPHYSFAYGNESIPPSLECPPDFVSSEMSVVWTHPSTLEGVRRWREIGHFSLS